MNKKFLTALLLGAFTIASTSTLVSCKDYDDDINGLQEQIDSNDQDIAALQSALNKAKTDLQADITKLEGELAAEKARAEAAEKKMADGLADEIARAKDAEGKIDDALLAEIARAKDAEGKLNDLLGAEVTRATAAEAALEAKIKAANEAIDAINKALDTKADKATFEAFVAEVNAKLKTLGDDLAAAQKALQTAIDNEAARAKAAEEAILGKLSDEQKAREDADKAEKDAREKAISGLQTQIDALDAFDKKIDARVKTIENDYLKAADKQELKDLIDAAKKDLEAKIAAAKAELETALAAQDKALRDLVADEKKALEGKITALDTKLSKAIQDEKDAREAADKKEAADRVKAIQDLQGQLDAAVISLQNQINTLDTKLKNEVSRLEGLISAAQDAADAAADAAQKAGLAAKQAQDDLADEISRATQAESDLNDAIGRETTARTQAITNLKTDLEREINQEITNRTNAVKAVSDKLDILSDIFSNSLRSLVLEPKFYYHGIQAIDASKFEYNHVINLQAANPNGDNSGDAPTYSPTATQIIPDLTATYHMNPSNAVISTDASKYSFVVLNREYTRAVFANKIQPKVYKATVNGGKVTVKASVSNVEYLQNIAADDAVTVLALQFKQKDTIITSDYAALKAYKYNNVLLNNAQLAPKGSATRAHAHLWRTAAEAIAEVYNEATNAATGFIVPINWDSNGIDLMEIVNSHRDIINGASTSNDVAWDTKASSGELKEYGLKYSFELLGYFVGANVTSESAHAQIYGTTLVPQQPAADGKQQTAADAAAAKALQNRGAELGREPLVRVTLTDTISNKKVQVGYIKFHITEAAVVPGPGPDPVYKTISYEYGDNYTVVCDPANSLNKKLKWNEIETDVLAAINQSSDEFRANYDIDGAADIFNQYNGNTASATLLTPVFGVVKHEVETAPNGANTDVISWVITNAEAWNKFKVNNKTEFSVYVRFHKLAAWSGVGRQDAYMEAPDYLVVKLTWKPGQINVSPETDFSSAKLPQYWHGATDIEASTGFDNIWGNVEVPGTVVPVSGKTTADGDDEFIFDIRNGLKGNSFTVGNINGYAALNAAKTAKVVFATPDVTSVKGSDGNTYTLSVSGETTSPSEFRATRGGVTKVIATMVTEGADQGIVTFQNNDYAKAVLNYAGRKQQGAGQTLTAKVKVIVNTCAPANTVKVNNNTFNVKFIRPVNAENGSVAFVDAVDGGDVKAITMAFTDWRGLWSTNPYNYFTYYGVAALTVPNTGLAADGIGFKIDATKVTTTLGTNSKLGDEVDGILTTQNGTTLSSQTSNLVLTYYPPVTVGTAQNGRMIHGKSVNDKGYGVIVYENNGTPVDNFEVRIPMTVTYDWGEFVTYINATVSKTIGVKKQ